MYEGNRFKLHSCTRLQTPPSSSSSFTNYFARRRCAHSEWVSKRASLRLLSSDINSIYAFSSFCKRYVSTLPNGRLEGCRRCDLPGLHKLSLSLRRRRGAIAIETHSHARNAMHGATAFVRTSSLCTGSPVLRTPIWSVCTQTSLNLNHTASLRARIALTVLD